MTALRAYLPAILLLAALAGCNPRPPATDYARTQTRAFTDTQNTALGKMYGSAAAQHPGESGFHTINSGLSALMTRIMLVEKAERSIDMQYYTTRDDKTGQLLLEAVVRAAARGVRVRILLDDWYLDEFKNHAAAFDAHKNIEIRIFNPYSTDSQSVFDRVLHAPSYVGDYDHRMHNKGFVVDNQVAVIGGRNLGDEYFDTSEQVNLRDIDLFTTGPVVGQLSTSFDEYWNSAQSYPITVLNIEPAGPEQVNEIDRTMQTHWETVLNSPDGQKLRSLTLPGKVGDGSIELIWAKAEFAADSPDKVTLPPEKASSVPATRIEQLANNAQHEFTAITPYFVPLETGVDWLGAMVKRGVKVRIVTNSLSSTDMVPAQSGYGHFREDLIKNGVDLYEVKSVPPKIPGKKMLTPSAPNGLHAKVYMVDRKDVVIGSFNFDARSMHLNTEQVLVIHSAELGEKIQKLFDDLSSLDKSYQVVPVETVPADQRPVASETLGTVVWKTKEDGQIKYFDNSPHAGFLRRLTNGFFSLLPVDKEL